MSDFILIDGDTVKFIPAFPPAEVEVQDGTIKGTGAATFGRTPVCVDGDESSVSVADCSYTVPPNYVTAGKGTLKIEELGEDQRATKTKIGGKPVLLKGTIFKAKFEVQSPAKQPVPGSSPVPDANISYTGQGTFENDNTKWKGT